METSTKKEYDVRVVHFEKTANRIGDTRISGSTNWDYICLGHFDRVTVDSLGSHTTSKKSPLQLIGEEQNYYKHDQTGTPPQDDNHVFSLYLLKEICVGQSCDDFWKPDTNFCAIIRLHCDLNTIQGQSSKILLCYLEDCFKQNQRMGYISPGKLKVCDIDVSYILYDSLELGDAVVVLKSESIVVLLEVARLLNLNNAVRDTYTYCLIQTNLLKEDSVEKVKTASKTNGQPFTLNYATTRFAIRDAYAADKFLDDIGIQLNSPDSFPKPFFITGSADLIVDWGSCTEAVFLNHMHAIANKGILFKKQSSDAQIMEQDTKSEATIQVAFSDVITRIGISYEKKAPGSSNPFSVPSIPPELEDCYAIKELPSFLQNESSHSDINSSFQRILGTLNSMSHNSVTDDLYNLLFPSTRAMFLRLSSIKEAENSLTKPYENMTREQWHHQRERYQADCLRYLEAWELLAGDITNLESQLVHHPELQVVRFYAPAMVLQFELEFVILCSKLLSDANSRCFIPMLALSQEDTVSTECLLDPLDTPYNGECALITHIPSKMLFNPWQVAHQLCHEMSHYCGDTSRRREKRAEVLCKCVAEWISRSWFSPYANIVMEVDENGNILSSIRNYCAMFRDKLSSKLYQALGPAIYEYHLETLRSKVSNQFELICNDHEVREEFQNHILSYFSADQQLNILGNIATSNRSILYTNVGELELFNAHLDYLTECLKECYADLSMMLLLKCSEKDYIQCVFGTEIESLEKQFSGNWEGIPDDSGEHTLEELRNTHIDRLALVFGARAASKLPSQHQCVITAWFAKFFPRQHNKETKSENQTTLPLLWNQEAEARKERALEALCGKENVYWGKKVDMALPRHLFMYEATEIIRYLADCEKDLQKKFNTNQGDIQTLRNALKAVHPESFDWSALQTFLYEARNNRTAAYKICQNSTPSQSTPRGSS